MKKLIILFLGLAVISCGGGDDEANDASDNRNFLQKYNGYAFAETDFFVSFHNSEVFMKWKDCSDDGEHMTIEMREGTNSIYSGTDTSDAFTINATILTNNSEELSVSLFYVEDDETDVVTYRVNPTGNTLIENYSDDDEFYIQRTNATISSFCN